METLNEKITALTAKRAEQVNAMQSLLDSAEDQERGLTADEQKQFDGFETEIANIDARMKNLETAEKRILKAPAVQTDLHSLGNGAKREKGCFFPRMAHALHVCGGDRAAAAEYVKRTFDDRELQTVLRAPMHMINKAEQAAAQTSVSTWAGALTIINDATGDFIDLLRPMSVMARTPARRMGFDGANSISIPRRTSGTSGVYLGEGKAIPVGENAFDNLILSPKKIAVITVSSTENLERSTPALEALLRDDMLRSTAETVDAQFISGTASAVAPGGIVDYGNAITPASGTAVANIAADLQALFALLDANNSQMMSMVIFMNPAEYNALLFAQDANSNYIYRSEVAGGTIFGATIIKSSSVAAGTVILADADVIMIAEDQAPTLDLTEDAAVHMDTAPEDDLAGVTPGAGVGEVRSLWQSDMVGIRLRWRHDWTVRQGGSIAYGTSVNWT